MRHRFLVPALAVGAVAALTGCTFDRTAEDPSAWFDTGEQLGVVEAVGYTDANYDFPASEADGIGAIVDLALTAPDSDTIIYAPGDGWDASDCPSSETTSLPTEVEGVVTLHPRYYFKTDGCDRDSDEKYYGSFFIQDRTGGIFVLGDSKVAHFDMGDRVRIKIRGVRAGYSGKEESPLPTVYAHDVVEVDYAGQDIYYEELTAEPTPGDIGKVFRVTGTVTGEMSTFGEVPFAPDFAGTTLSGFHIKLDQELTRRGYAFSEGTRLQVTGPMLLSYSEYSPVVMRVGQFQILADE